MKEIISGIGETMADTDKDTTNEVVTEKAVIMADAGTLASNDRIEKMDLLSRKLAGEKAAMTREGKKLEQAMTAFQKAGTEGSAASILQMKAKEVVTSNEKLQKLKDELQTIADDLTEVILESKSHELKESRGSYQQDRRGG